MKRSCFDSNLKIVTRVYDWDGKRVEIDLCEKHRSDSDFSKFIEEIPIVGVLKH